MKWARIENNIVREIVDQDPEGRFHQSLTFVQCGDEVCCGWEFDGQSFSEPEIVGINIDVDNMTQEEKRQVYEAYAKNAIAENYSIADEIKILRRNSVYFAENGTNTEEFEEYNEYVEQCIDGAFQKVYQKND